MKKLVNDEYIDLTPEEVDAINQLKYIDWHKPLPIRVLISKDVEAEWALKMQRHNNFNNYPEIAALLDYVKTISASQIEHNGAIHIYLSELYPEHMAILERHGAVVEFREDI